MRYHSVVQPYSRAFRLPFLKPTRFLIILALLAATLHASFGSVKAASSSELIPFIESYFGARYEALQNLQLPEEFSSFFDPHALAQPSLFNEPNRLQAYLAYLQAQQSDMHLSDSWQIHLSYPAMHLLADRAEVIVSEQYEYSFIGAPNEIHRGTNSHLLTLNSDSSGSWRIVRDEYHDPKGILQQLDAAFYNSNGGLARANLIASLLPRFEAHTTKLSTANAEIMRDYPTQIVFFKDQNAIWVNGRSLPLDSAANLTPMVWNGEVYLPIRVLVENLGGSIEWTPLGRRSIATYNGHTLAFSTFDFAVLLDDETIPMKQANTLVSNRSYLPASLLAQFLGHQLYQSSSGTIILAPRALSDDQLTALFNRFEEINRVQFSLNDFPTLASSKQAKELALNGIQELLGLSTEETALYMPYLEEASPYQRLIANEVKLVLGAAPSEAEKDALRRAGIDLSMLPLGNGIVAVYRQEEAPKSPARRFAIWLGERFNAEADSLR